MFALGPQGATCGVKGAFAMTTSDEYQFYALECTRWADASKNEPIRQALLETAKACAQRALNKQGAVRPADERLPVAASARFPSHIFPLSFRAAAIRIIQHVQVGRQLHCG
jgi:hypothetical protein